MLAYMKMAKSDDAGPWFAPPSRLYSEIQDSKSQFFCKNSMETPETSLEMNSEPEQHSNMDEDSPLCLVVKKNKDGHYSSLVSEDKEFLPTPPGSPAESHFSTSHPRLSSPLRVDVHQQSLSVSPVSSSHFQDQNSHQNLFNSLPLISSADFMESPIFARALASGAPKRPRGEKKPIPDEQKDGKYYERRKRNNLAAKKSRDARKSREDQIALRATTLEKENAVLRAQLVTLREEADSLRLLLIQKRSR